MSLPSHFPLKAAEGKTIHIPSVGFGTFSPGSPGWCKDAVLIALKAGYRHLDCAWIYGVDEEVGAAIRESGIPRSEIFITSKFRGHFAAPENVELSLDKVLQGMGLDYVDLFLAHWPVALKPVSKEALKSKEGSFVPTWQAMKKLVATGKTRAVGLSNFSISEIKELLPYADDVPISCNQIEAHPWLPNNKLIDFMKEHDILTVCYSPFAGQKPHGATWLLNDPTVKRVAEKNGMDVGQCLQSWHVQRGTIPLGKSQTESRIKSNLAVRRLPLEDMKALDDLELPDGKGRTIDFSDAWGVKLFTN
ncbi:hypothetical protein A1O3_04955 [Capronia epimyces CBS 606.96]|uniref:D-xylose reductase [NAD(P)H] n=1 Tax=Capronia epimyces CBS 606.96 TaxID=1182542 RepID=W9XVM8_9EURO|nr:uncharacterized protein A1O3_04955 [Capronia epimyces CBS 606.96]EXJ84288.1 hypothetical protein A1O3_04955 [Capronia epimyces CBS 606.96]